MQLLSAADFIIPVVVGLACLAWASGWLRSRRLTSAIGGLGLGYFAIRTIPVTVISMPDGHFDFTSFWIAGQEVLKGLDPIVENENKLLPPLNLPTAFPLFAILALAPYRLSFLVWTVVNGGLTLLLGLVCWLLADASRSEPYDRRGMLLVIATMALSNATRSCLTSGQLGILAATCLMLAVLAHQRHRWVASATALAIATVKIGTVLPFVVLFRSKHDLKIWIAVAIICFGLAAITERPGQMPERARQWLSTLDRLSQPGAVNDFALPQNDDMIALDHAFHRAGIRDRGMAKRFQLLTLAGLGVVLLVRMKRSSSEERSTLLALTCVYASLFLYHRLTDMAILAFPFTLAILRARQAAGWSRVPWLGAATALLSVLFLQRRGLVALRGFAQSHAGPIGSFIEGLVLPYACWALLIAFFLMAFVKPAESTGTGVIHQTGKPLPRPGHSI